MKARFRLVLLICIVSILGYSCAQPQPLERDLVSLRNDGSIEGSFFVGCGFIRGREYYFAFIQTSRGITRLTVPVERGYIIEYSGKPKCVIIRSSMCGGGCLRQVTFYVPKGTVLQRFEVK